MTLEPERRDAIRALVIENADATAVAPRLVALRAAAISAAVLSLIGVAVATATIAGFGGSKNESSAVSSTVIGGFEVQEADGTTLVAATTSNQMQALLIGTIRLQDGCFVMESSDAQTPLVFPKGTQLSRDGLSAEVPGFGRVVDGDAINGGGGQVPEAGIFGHCAKGGDVIMWQSGG